MSTLSRPRGPLPPRVYWTRRVLVLCVALGLVFALGRFLESSRGGADPARAVGAEATGAPGQADGSRQTAADAAADQPATKQKKPKSRKKPKKPVLPAPTGPCADSDIVVTPVVGEVYAAQPVPIALEITTGKSRACTWAVAPSSVVLKVTKAYKVEGEDGGRSEWRRDRVWTTQECPRVVPKVTVVARRAHPATVQVVWRGQRSNAECSMAADWAMPGRYHAEAAAQGSEHAVDVKFVLGKARARTTSPTTTSAAESTAESTAESRSPAAGPSGGQSAEPTP